jgi:dolichyl-phosphate-mannose-protein mannosyltransferase
MPSIVDQTVETRAQETAAERSQRTASESAGVSGAPRKASFGQSIAVLMVVWILSVTWMGANLNRGWVAHDDGMLAQSAERVLSGQLPHRDFDEVYTGGLSYLHAAAFKLFGTNLMSLRYTLLIFFALWVPALYYCASRFANPYAAGLVTLLGVAWSVPNYPASMPSWYSLFFATFGIAALLKYLESRSSRWPVLAGLCGGFSFLVKSPGIYFVGAVLIFFAFLEQSNTYCAHEAENRASSGKLYRFFLSLSVWAFVIALGMLIRRIATFPELYFFVLPGFVLGLVLLARESSVEKPSSAIRFRSLFGMAAPFLAGVLAPIAIFLIPYTASHSLRSLYEGIFVIPFLRLSIGVFPPPKLGNLIALPPLVAILAFAWYSKRRDSLLVAVLVLAGLAAILFYSPKETLLYRFVWMSVFTSAPVFVVAGGLVLSRGGAGWAINELRRQQIFLILSGLVLCSLIQFPYSSATYFCYTAPLLALAILAFTASRNPAPKLLPALLAIFFMAFIALWVTPGMQLDGMSVRYVSAGETQPLATPRAGGLRLPPEEAQMYDKVLALVQQKATNGALYAGPDSPEVYFLSGMPNPTRMVFDVFEDYSGETDRVLSAIDATNPNIVVINRIPLISNPLPAGLIHTLEARYPQMLNFGKFQVRWRE